MKNTIQLIDTDTNTLIMEAWHEDTRVILLKDNLNRKEGRERYIITD